MTFEGYKDIYTYNESLGIVLVDIKLALCKNDFSNVVQAGNTLLIFNNSIFSGNHYASRYGIAIVRCLMVHKAQPHDITKGYKFIVYFMRIQHLVSSTFKQTQW